MTKDSVVATQKQMARENQDRGCLSRWREVYMNAVRKFGRSGPTGQPCCIGTLKLKSTPAVSTAAEREKMKNKKNRMACTRKAIRQDAGKRFVVIAQERSGLVQLSNVSCWHRANGLLLAPGV
jgi:hypothetical protein